jgi:acyl dehydratase
VEAAEDEVAYFEDIEVGERYDGSERYQVTRDEIVEYARKWDSRDYHVDEEAARRSIFGGLVASGSHVIAIWTRLSLAARRELRPWATLAGLGSEIEMRTPTRPGDELRYLGEVIEKRASSSRPGAGIVRTRHRLLNQGGDVVFESVSAVLVKARSPRAA